MPTAVSQIVRFGVFELDLRSGELRRHGLKVRLPDQAFQILKVLLHRPGNVVTREELRHVLWSSETFVDFEVGLNSAVRKLREALDDSADNPRFVETLPRRGYRFIASVESPAADPPQAPRPDSLEPATLAGMSPSAAVATAAIPPQAAPARARPSKRALLAALVITLTIAAGAAYRWGGVAMTPSGTAAAPIRALVVLPFENLTGDGAQDYFADSVTDALTVHLAQAEGLEVISRTSARQYKQTARRLPDIGRELGVDGVVAGTVMRSAAGVRITVRLLRAATDRHIWAQSYEGDLGHMMDLQRRIASELAVAAGQPAPKLPGSRATRPIDARAYDAYLQGQTAKGLQRYEGFRRAVAYFEEAVALQPDFAEAYAELALAQVQFLHGGPLAPHDAIPKAEAAARKALQLDGALARAHWALGQILSLYHWRWKEGDEALERAAALQSDRDELFGALSTSLIRRGRFQEAIAAAERGRRLDPLALSAQVALGIAYRASGQHDRAITELRRAREMSPANNRVQFQLGVTYTVMGRLEDAIRELESAARPAQGHNTRVEAYLGYAYAAAGRAADARRVLRELESHAREQYVSRFGIALIHDALNEKAAAVAAVQRAAADRAVEFAQMYQYPPFRAIAAEPAFLAVMGQVGLSR